MNRLEAYANFLVNGGSFDGLPQPQSRLEKYLFALCKTGVGVKTKVVSTLPTEGESGTIYFVPNSGSAPNASTEYMYIEGAWEQIGSTSVSFNELELTFTKSDGTTETHTFYVEE